MVHLEGSNRGAGLRFAIVVAKFNDFVTDRLQAGALDALASAGVGADDISVRLPRDRRPNRAASRPSSASVV
jgi:6,7-dimethyl-8-ribityllumazine synthase